MDIGGQVVADHCTGGLPERPVGVVRPGKVQQLECRAELPDPDALERDVDEGQGLGVAGRGSRLPAR